MRAYSLVTTVFNDQKEILEYMKNMSEQTYQPSEIIIADGGSTDKTTDIIEEFSKGIEIPVKIITGKRLNIAEGFNEAIKIARYELIGISAVGNIYDKDFYKNLIHTLDREELDAVYAPVRGLDCNRFSKKYNNMFLNGNDGERILSNHGFVARKEVFEELGYYYEGFYYAGEDTEFAQRISESRFKVRCEENAKLYWKTPKNYSEFIKQIKYYYIASLQIHGVAVIYKSYKMICSIAFMFVMMFFSWRYFLIALSFFMILHMVKAMQLKLSGGDFYLWFLKRYVQICFFVKYIKFGIGDNVVNR